MLSRCRARRQTFATVRAMNAISRGRILLTLIALVAIMALASGCGNDKSDNKGTGQKSVPEVVRSDKAEPQVTEHGGLVYGAFHTYVLEPSRAGKLDPKTAEGRQAIAKARAATLVMIKELGLAKQASLTDDRLRPVSVKIDDLMPRLALMLSRMDAGTVTSADINRASGALDNILREAKKGGADIPLDKVPAVK